MSRPDVSLENHEELYDYYAQHRQNRVFARAIAHPLLGKVFRPTITFDSGVQTQDAIKDALDAKTRLVVSPNHLTGDDQYVVVSVAQRVKEFHRLRGHTFIPTEPSLSTRPGITGSLLRWSVDELGSIPIVRLEDLKRQGIEIDDEMKERHERAMKRAHVVEVEKIIQGDSMAGFMEGTRNRVDHRKVQPPKKGIAYTAIEAAQKVGVSFLPMGMYYGGEPKSYKKLDVPAKWTPHVHIGNLIPVEPDMTPDDLVSVVHPAIQKCVDRAVASSTAVHSSH